MAKTPLVAVVDDDEAVREALCELLMVAGLDCTAFDGAPAFLAADSGAFDALVTDIRMPGMTGIELLDRLRTAAPDGVRRRTTPRHAPSCTSMCQCAPSSAERSDRCPRPRPTIASAGQP